MKSSLTRSKLQVKQSPIHGYGVFADDDIEADSIIEECYTLIHKKEVVPFSSFYFSADQYAALALGFGSIYNHSNNPNARMVFDHEHSLVVFYAKRAIKSGEEICISYGKEWFESRKLLVLKPSWRFRMREFIKTSPPWTRFTAVVAGLVGVLFLLN
jgi:SET domain-containing protein